jgi:hypothetical protein
MALSHAATQKAIKQYFAAQVKNLETATAIAIKTTAQKLGAETKRQLRTFKRGPGASGGFQKAVKVYNLPQSGARGPASYVRLGVPWIGIFQEGGTVTGNLIILLPEGAKLGFKRIKKGAWDLFVRQQGANIVPKKVGTAVIIFFKKNKSLVPIYKIQKSVRLPKKLTFYENAEVLADDMANLIATLME